MVRASVFKFFFFFFVLLFFIHFVCQCLPLTGAAVVEPVDECGNFDLFVPHVFLSTAQSSADRMTCKPQKWDSASRRSCAWHAGVVRHVIRLKAEAKSGSTWVGNLVKDLLLSVCLDINRFGGKQCVFFPNEKWYPAGRVSWIEWTRTVECQANYCSMQRQPGEYEKRLCNASQYDRNFIMFIEGHKHTIPFVSHHEHPNVTPFHLPIPPWLKACVRHRQRTGKPFECWPSRDGLVAMTKALLQQMYTPVATTTHAKFEKHCTRSPNEVGATATDLAAARVEALDPSLLAQWTHADRVFRKSLHSSQAPAFANATTTREFPAVSFPIPESLQFLSLLRDPRAVALSAASYTPGKLLFGPRVSSNNSSPATTRMNQQRESIDAFVLGFVNKSAAWTQFRRFWFGTNGPFAHTSPVETFYEQLTSQVRRTYCNRDSGPFVLLWLPVLLLLLLLLLVMMHIFMF